MANNASSSSRDPQSSRLTYVSDIPSVLEVASRDKSRFHANNEGYLDLGVIIVTSMFETFRPGTPILPSNQGKVLPFENFESVLAKSRRMVVLRHSEGIFIALPIFTYNDNGLRNKPQRFKGVHLHMNNCRNVLGQIIMPTENPDDDELYAVVEGEPMPSTAYCRFDYPVSNELKFKRVLILGRLTDASAKKLYTRHYQHILEKVALPQQTRDEERLICNAQTRSATRSFGMQTLPDNTPRTPTNPDQNFPGTRTIDQTSPSLALAGLVLPSPGTKRKAEENPESDRKSKSPRSSPKSPSRTRPGNRSSGSDGFVQLNENEQSIPQASSSDGGANPGPVTTVNIRDQLTEIGQVETGPSETITRSPGHIEVPSSLPVSPIQDEDVDVITTEEVSTVRKALWKKGSGNKAKERKNIVKLLQREDNLLLKRLRSLKKEGKAEGETVENLVQTISEIQKRAAALKSASAALSASAAQATSVENPNFIAPASAQLFTAEREVDIVALIYDKSRADAAVVLANSQSLRALFDAWVGKKSEAEVVKILKNTGRAIVEKKRIRHHTETSSGSTAPAGFVMADDILAGQFGPISPISNELVMIDRVVSVAAATFVISREDAVDVMMRNPDFSICLLSWVGATSEAELVQTLRPQFGLEGGEDAMLTILSPNVTFQKLLTNTELQTTDNFGEREISLAMKHQLMIRSDAIHFLRDPSLVSCIRSLRQLGVPEDEVFEHIEQAYELKEEEEVIARAEQAAGSGESSTPASGGQVTTSTVTSDGGNGTAEGDDVSPPTEDEIIEYMGLLPGLTRRQARQRLVADNSSQLKTIRRIYRAAGSD